ncbi:MAG TPA: hypothetical protein DIC64_05680 [Alphaproteobacteria bacterium]|nr:hypothetical protein [Alphaproteobacteria bacterium]
MRKIAFIPARGGSRSIPLKNIKNLAGHPLIYYVLKAAEESKVIDEIVVATENEKIKSVVSEMNFSKVKIFNRSLQTAQENSPTIDVVQEYLQKSDVKSEDYLFLIQATSPLLQAKDIDGIFKKMLDDKCDTAITCARSKRYYWNDNGYSLNFYWTDELNEKHHLYQKRTRRQEMKGCLLENGAIHLTTVASLIKNKDFVVEPCSVYEMDATTAVEIDEPIDWMFVETIMSNTKE